MSLNKAIQHFKKTLREKKQRVTKQRIMIAELFLASGGHKCVDELYYSLRRKFPTVGYTTVYRTLKLLKNAGMASEVNFTGKRKRFEHSFERPHHDHLICVKCGNIIEFFDPEIEKKQEILCKKYKFKGEGHQMQISGICRVCQKKGK